MDEFYFYASYKNGKVKTRGAHHKLFGHKIAHTPGKKTDGVFAEWSWNGDTLTIENDRYGFYPLYYYCTHNEVCVSTSIMRLIAEGAPKTLDYTALSVFLRIGFFISEDTPFKHIRALPPNAEFQWSNGQLKVSGEYCCAKNRSSLSYDEAIDKYIYLFRQSMKRRLPSDKNFAVPTTGGKDSRHILFELDALGSLPKFCLTIQRFAPGENDIPVGRLVAERFNLKHIALDPPKSYFKNEMRRNFESSFCSDELREGTAVTDYLSGKVNIYFDGIAGDALSTTLFCNPTRVGLYEEQRFSDLAKRIISGQENTCFPEDVFKKIFPARLYKKMSQEHAVDHLIHELKKHAHTPNPTSQFFFWNRTRREIALSPYAISSPISTIYSPYLDHDLYDFLSSLDARSYILDHDFHTEAIARAYPQHADLPYEDKSNVTNARSLQKRYARNLIMYLVKQHNTAHKNIRFKYAVPGLIKYFLKGSNWWITPHLIHYWVELTKYADME